MEIFVWGSTDLWKSVSDWKLRMGSSPPAWLKHIHISLGHPGYHFPIFIIFLFSSQVFSSCLTHCSGKQLQHQPRDTRSRAGQERCTWRDAPAPCSSVHTHLFCKSSDSKGQKMIQECLSSLMRDVYHLTWCIVVFSLSTIWDLLGASDSTEGEYRRDPCSPADTHTLWALMLSGCCWGLRMELSSSGCQCQLQEGGKRWLPHVHPSYSCPSCNNPVLSLAAIGMQMTAPCLTSIPAASAGGPALAAMAWWGWADGLVGSPWVGLVGAHWDVLVVRLALPGMGWLALTH